MELCATLANTAFLNSLNSDALARAAPSKNSQTIFHLLNTLASVIGMCVNIHIANCILPDYSTDF